MSSTTHEVTLPLDEKGFLGRECPAPDCESQFKIKPGTGLKGDNLPCHCPYCGCTEPHDHFHTKQQIEYAESIALRRVTNDLNQAFKELEFSYPPKGPFGIGISLKVTPGEPVPIRYYREPKLETEVVCDDCTLEYAIYGVFAYCPDCGSHNSLQILTKNLDLVLKEVELAATLTDPEFVRHLLEDALENCVSSFDGFGRETCRIRASKSTDPAKCREISFQNLPRAADRLQKLFGIALVTSLDTASWQTAYRGFLKRHVIAHHAGVVDDQYLIQSGDHTAIVGRRIPLEQSEIYHLVAVLREFGKTLLALLPAP
jgi:hypothetical protein